MTFSNPESISPIESQTIADRLTAIQEIFTNKNPLQQLEKYANDVPKKISHEQLIQLRFNIELPDKREASMSELVYYCLPQAAKLIHESEDLGIDTAELFSLTMQSLIEAITEWNPDINNKEISKNESLQHWVTQKVRKNIHEHIAQEYKLTLSRYELVPIFMQMEKEFVSIHKHLPNPKDWSEFNDLTETYASNLSPELLESYHQLRFIASKNSEEVKLSVQPIDGLKVIFDQMQDQRMHESKFTNSAEEFSEVNENILKEQISTSLKILPEEMQKVVQLYFGIPDGESHTLQQIALQEKVSISKIQQTLARALRTLRDPKINRRFRDFWSR